MTQQKTKKEKYYFQKGGAIRYPNRYFNPDATPFEPCDCGKHEQQGGAIAYPYRYFNPDATPFRPCDCLPHECNCHQQHGGCGTCGQVPYPQHGGNSVQIPYHLFNKGQPLKMNYSYQDNFSGTPVFDPVQTSHFWY